MSRDDAVSELLDLSGLPTESAALEMFAMDAAAEGITGNTTVPLCEGWHLLVMVRQTALPDSFRSWARIEAD